MPYLKIPFFRAIDTDNNAPRYLAGIMLYPNDLKKQIMLEEAYNADKVLPLHLRGHAETIVSQAANGFGDKAMLAGSQLLMTLYTDRKFSSLRLTKEAIDLEYKNKFGPTSKTSLESSWRDFRDVAHLWAARCLFTDPVLQFTLKLSQEFPCSTNDMFLFLSFAEVFREAGEKFRSARSPKNEFLLDKETTWKAPLKFPLIKNCLDIVSFESRHRFIEAALSERTQQPIKT